MQYKSKQKTPRYAVHHYYLIRIKCFLPKTMPVCRRTTIAFIARQSNDATLNHPSIKVQPSICPVNSTITASCVHSVGFLYYSEDPEVKKKSSSLMLFE
ncbi:hypothetical protein CEXT_309011 [Caerostris extrusa]|uniref:Uncharacterized protein n=1 Tax=Caerostris extrusa TaxID=172846 RepID=A0AAV4NH50_CAEEX|nr:hypothetical protein CEXT_309011 [Caerostris extrusa]